MSEDAGDGFLLISVTDGSPQSLVNLEALLASVGRQGVSGEIVVVMRDDAATVDSRVGGFEVHLTRMPKRTGVSRARNAGLSFARENGLLASARVVAFPDDDCEYPEGLLPRVAARIGADVQVVVGPYGPSSDEINRDRFPEGAETLTMRTAMHRGNSISVFFDRVVIERVGNFDERLGVGARFGSSEDCDMLLRTIEHGFTMRYEPETVLVLHPYKRGRPEQYYSGWVAVLAKHARYERRFVVSLLAELAFGLYGVLSPGSAVSRHTK